MSLTPTIYEPSTDAAFHMLLTIYPSDGSDPLRVTDNNEPVTSRGETFEPYPFRITLPPESDEAMPHAGIDIDNVAPELMQIVRGLLNPPTVTIEIVLSITPDEVERSLDHMVLRDVKYDALTVKGKLQAVNIFTEPFPGTEYLPSNFPALFYGS